jgi:hypothetical protein
MPSKPKPSEPLSARAKAKARQVAEDAPPLSRAGRLALTRLLLDPRYEPTPDAEPGSPSSP